MKNLRIAFAFSTLALVAPSHSQNRIGTGMVDELYQQYCASCHGQDLAGGSSVSLIDEDWKYGSSNAEIARAIRDGFPDLGMIGFGDSLGDERIRSLVIYIREKAALAKSASRTPRQVSSEGVFTSSLHSFSLEKVGQAAGIIWSMDFMPDGGIIATQRDGKLWIFQEGEQPEQITGIPEIWQRGQGGLLEVALHPDYAENQWVYLSYSESVGGKERGRTAGMTAVVRGRVHGNKWVDQENLFNAPVETHTSAGTHFGSRFVFKDGYLYFAIGDRGRQNQAQDLSLPNGKIHRLHDDGRIPADNPFVDKEDAMPSIWSYGHRNPQGLDLNPATGELWETEHGPRGGDETNLIHKGLNYGWPEITYGMNYNGLPITDRTEAEGMEQPKHYWVPSISVCGIDFYEGDLFPSWKGDLFVTGLASQQLHRLRIENGEVTSDEIVLKGVGRLRDIANGPDGSLYLSVEDASRHGTIYRLRPAKN